LWRLPLFLKMVSRFYSIWDSPYSWASPSYWWDAVCWIGLRHSFSIFYSYTWNFLISWGSLPVLSGDS
jgi:hypothetical protein